MLSQIVAKCFNSNQKTVVEITSMTVVFEALCAYRDQLIMDDVKYGTPETTAKLLILHTQIDEIWNQLPV